MKIDRTNKEMEFKCLIDKKIYLQLIEEFALKNNIFTQTNFYFDTDNYDLKKDKIVLRIRQKNNQFKLTKKVHLKEHDIDESHIYLEENNALDMIQNGFDANIIGLSYFVKNTYSLTTNRVSFPYKNGKLFFDESIYNGITDYEIEYEANNIEEGNEVFNEFLISHNIKLVIPDSKIIRAYKTLKANN